LALVIARAPNDSLFSHSLLLATIQLKSILVTTSIRGDSPASCNWVALFSLQLVTVFVTQEIKFGVVSIYKFLALNFILRNERPLYKYC